MPTFMTKSDAELALDFLRLIPSGRWTNYGEIAECVNSVTPDRPRPITGYGVALRLMPYEGEAWHRLRNAEGVFNVAAKTPGNHADVQNRCDQRLRDEGCPVSAHHAATANHVSASQLLRLGNVRTAHVPNVLSAEAQRRVDERVAERVARLNRP